MNSGPDLGDLLIEGQFLHHPNDPYENHHLKTSKQEEEDFLILNEPCHAFLFGIYGGK